MKIKLLCSLTALLVAAGCSEQKSKEQNSATEAATPVAAAKSAAAPVTFSTFPVPTKPEVTPQFVEHGKEIYLKNCAACHGEKGDGKGICSAFLLPQPRDFTHAQYRLRSTATGSLPTDEDLFRVVSLGLAGTPMPP
jgi:hypothetical protein